MPSTKPVAAQIESMFGSHEAYLEMLHKACAQVPDYRPDGPRMGYIFDDAPSNLGGFQIGSKRAAPDAAHLPDPAKIARMSAMASQRNPDVTKSAEEESKRLKRQQVCCPIHMQTHAQFVLNSRSNAECSGCESGAQHFDPIGRQRNCCTSAR